jgi:histidinol-phosphate aminotransferase
MSRFDNLISSPARNLGSYIPDFSRGQSSSQPRVIKLDSNENPFGPSPRAIEAMRGATESMHEYPDDDCIELRTRLAARHNVSSEQVLVTPGSAGMLSLLCQTLLAPGRNAVTSRLSFIVYGMVVRASGAHLIETPQRVDGFDLDAILDAINPDTRLVFLANPNNPTGTMLDANAVDGFLARVPAHVVVVLDEAYYDFAAHFATLRKVDYSRSIEYVRRDANVVVLRTFSKVHGLAGLRIGYGLGHAELLGYCARMASTYSVSSVAQAAAMAALDDQQHVDRAVANNATQAEVLITGLSEPGFRVVPTAANFVYCDIGTGSATFAGNLLEEGVSVRPMAGWGAQNCIRVTIGTPEQNQIFLHAVKRVAGKFARAGRSAPSR